MPSSRSRVCSQPWLPSFLRLIEIVLIILVMINVGTAKATPGSISFVWFATSFALFWSAPFMFVTIVAFLIEIIRAHYSAFGVATPPVAELYIVEGFVGIFSAILCFASVWVCVDAAQYNDGKELVYAEFLCFASFVVIGFKSAILIQVHSLKRQDTEDTSNILSSETTSYGGI